MKEETGVVRLMKDAGAVGLIRMLELLVRWKISESLG